MPLNSSNYRDVTQGVKGADDVLLSFRPSTVAMAEDWNTEIVRRPAASSDGQPSTDPATEVPVKTVPAGQRVVIDESVQSTTDPFWWRARHVRPGSTAGPWTNWKGGNPRNDADSSIHSSLNVAQLDVITNDIGKLTAGTLANTTGTRFINLSATGSNDFIHVEDASGSTTLSIQADGDADFGGVVSSSRLTADEVRQGTTDRNITLRSRPVGVGSTESFIDFNSGGDLDGQIKVSTDFVELAQYQSGALNNRITIGPSSVNVLAGTIGLNANSSNLKLQAGGDVLSVDRMVFDANDPVRFQGNNLSTSATTGLGPDLWLTVNTTAGKRKLPLYQT